MTPSKLCKAAGLKGLSELCRITQLPRSTLKGWAETKPKALACLIAGAAVEKNKPA